MASGSKGPYQFDIKRNMQISQIRESLSERLGCHSSEFDLVGHNGEPLWSKDLIEDLGRDIQGDVLHIEYKICETVPIDVEIAIGQRQSRRMQLRIRKPKNEEELRYLISRKYQLPYESVVVKKLLKDEKKVDLQTMQCNY